METCELTCVKTDGSIDKIHAIKWLPTEKRNYPIYELPQTEWIPDAVIMDPDGNRIMILRKSPANIFFC